MAESTSTVFALPSANPTFDFALGILSGYKTLVYGPHDSPLPSPQPSRPGSPCRASPPSDALETGFADFHETTAQRPSIPPMAIPSPPTPLILPQIGPSMPCPSSAPVIATGAENLTHAEKRKLQEKQQSKRNKRRKKDRATEVIPDRNSAKKHLQEGVQVTTAFKAENMSIVDTGYICGRSANSSSIYTLEDVIGPKAKFNLKLKTWKGNNTMVGTDSKQRAVAIFVSKPAGDESWDDVQQRAAAALEAARHRLHFSKKDKGHRRGDFPALAIGISHGGGQPYPKMRSQDPRNKEVLDTLMSDKSLQRISGHATGAFAEWAPRLYAYENKYLTNIIEHDEQLRKENRHPKPSEPKLCRNWPRTPWAATTFNFGPRTICAKHLDYNNLAFGWCGITALGQFDHTKGGHLILWDLGLVVEFPAGCTILIPSAAIQHSNVCVGPHEQRYSVTQYSAGGIFRWIDNKYQSVVDFRAKLSPGELAEALQQLSEQLDFGLSLYSDVAELEKKRGVPFKYVE